MKTNKSRRPKVARKVVERRSLSTDVPAITLCGKWLRDAGFSIGDKININLIEEGVLIHRSVEDSNAK